jgi:3-dehydroquinate synthase
MTTIQSDGYPIMAGDGALKALSAFLKEHPYSSYFILCDENTLQACLPILISACPALRQADIIEVESGESAKSLDFSANIWETLLENQADKQSLLINLGGGVVSDLGGFSASVYKRGIDFIHVPTSLLAMADASVGGKTGIDFLGIKNCIGTFSSPRAVFIYPGFLMSLPERHFQNGLAEVYKIALTCDKKFWEQCIHEGSDAESLILQSVKLKNKIVLRDPFDQGIRNVLNFGHTLGHALESFYGGTEKELLHGEAVVAGMIMESHISVQKKMLSRKELSEISTYFRSAFTLPSLEEASLEALLRLAGNDKKTSRSRLRMSLIDRIGSCKHQVEVSSTQIRKSLEYYASLFQ